VDPRTITLDPVTAKLRRVGRVARHRMRIDAHELRNGRHTDGTVTVEISGLSSPTAGTRDSFAWSADRPIALVIVRAGVDGDDVSFDVGPATSGIGRTAGIGDGSGIRYVAFCYDAPIESSPTVATPATVAAVRSATPPPSRWASPAAPRTFTPTRRERRSILSLLLDGTGRRSPGGSLA
jgi:hypothetical protein